MSKNTSSGAERYSYTQNRELSWLRFNQRVLEEANDRTNPALERLKFVSIFSSNLDEFFMVRVGSLFDVARISPTEIDNKSGLSPAQQLSRIYQTVPGLIELKKQIYASVVSDLSKYGVADLRPDELNAAEQKYINRYFQSSILPILSPIIIGSHHPVPHLTSKSLYIAASLQDKKGRSFIGFVPAPESLPPYIKLPGTGIRFLRTENIILQWVPTMIYKTIVIDYAPKAKATAAAVQEKANEMTAQGFELVTMSITNSAKAILVFKSETEITPNGQTADSDQETAE